MDESELEVQKDILREADPDGMFLCALQDYPYMMTPDHISEFIGISSQEIRRLLCNGQMKGCRVGNRWFVPKLALLRYLHPSPSNESAEKGQEDGSVTVR